MARPQKQTADYFPHYVNASKTLFIFESKFENDGYTLWFKLLSTLCATEGHVLDGENPQNIAYLASITRIREDVVLFMLDTLADLGAIDTDLWREDKLIWCQNLVNNLADLYRKRRRPDGQPGRLPDKPVLRRLQSHSPVSGAGLPEPSKIQPAEKPAEKPPQLQTPVSGARNARKGVSQSRSMVTDVGNPPKPPDNSQSYSPVSDAGNMPEKGITKQNKSNYNIKDRVEKGKPSIITQADAIAFVLKRAGAPYIEQLRHEFTDVKFDDELLKFSLFWTEGRRTLKRPKLALHNWLLKAREFKTRAPAGPTRGTLNKALPDTKTLKEGWK